MKVNKKTGVVAIETTGDALKIIQNIKKQMETPLKTFVEVVLTLKVPLERVNEVSQKLLDFVGELGVMDGGNLTQSDVKFEELTPN